MREYSGKVFVIRFKHISLSFQNKFKDMKMNYLIVYQLMHVHKTFSH